MTAGSHVWSLGVYPAFRRIGLESDSACVCSISQRHSSPMWLRQVIAISARYLDTRIDHRAVGIET
jgi:hypothetical protein